MYNGNTERLTLWRPLYGYSYKTSCARPGCNFWHLGTLALRVNARWRMASSLGRSFHLCNEI